MEALRRLFRELSKSKFWIAFCDKFGGQKRPKKDADIFPEGVNGRFILLPEMFSVLRRED